MSDQQNYASYFAGGMRVGVGIPLHNAEVFRDWAFIEELDEDLIWLQLSRDQLPVNVKLNVGQILEIRGGKDDNGYSCRAIIVSEGDAKQLLLRLIGEIVSDELREFYRIDAFLPIKYYLTHEQHPELLEKEWSLRRLARLANEQQRRQKRWDSTYMGGSARLPDEKLLEHDEDDEDTEWDTIIPLAANISGGGMRVITRQGFAEKEYILLEILVPTPRRIVDAVARVIFAHPLLSGGVESGYFNTGLQFVFIDEVDRDSIVSHISNIQLKRIRQLRETYLFRDGHGKDLADGAEALDRYSRMKLIVIGLLLLSLLVMSINYFRNYSQNRPKNEIEEIFENAIKRYIELQKK